MQATTHDPDTQHLDLQLIPVGFKPEGISEARLADLFDENTQYLLLTLLPAQYMAIFVYILRYATTSPKTTMQQSLFASIGESNDCAIVLYRKLEALAKAKDSPAGPETFLKAIVIFEALQIISRRTFHAGYTERYTEIRIPLGKREILIPELRRELRRVYHEYKDEKIRQLVVKTAKKLKTEEFIQHIPRPAAASIDPELKIHLTRLLAEHGITETNIRIPVLAEACSIISSMHAHKSGRVLADLGEFHSVPPLITRKQKGESDFQKGESCNSNRQTASSAEKWKAPFQGDSENLESPFLGKSRARRRAKCLQKGELDALFGQESPESAQKGGVSAYSGDSEGGLSMSVITPSSENSLEERDALIDTETSAKSESPEYVDERSHWEISAEADLYKRKFDQASGKSWKGSLYNIVRSTPRAIRDIAEVATFFYLQFGFPDRRTMFAPGGWFTKACVRYQQSLASIPEEIRVWTQSGLSVDEIIKQIRDGKRHPAQMMLTFDPEEENPSGEVPVATPEEYYELPVTPRTPHMGHGWMRETEAEALRDRIIREGERFGIQAKVFPGAQPGTWIVETSWEDVLVQHCSPAQWEYYFEQTSACYDE